MRLTRSGTISLRVDAAYCTVAAVFLAASISPVAAQFGISTGVIGVVVLVVLGWSALLFALSKRSTIRMTLVFVASANFVAALLLALFASMQPLGLFSILLWAVAFEVAAFAYWQFRCLSFGSSP